MTLGILNFRKQIVERFLLVFKYPFERGRGVQSIPLTLLGRATRKT